MSKGIVELIEAIGNDNISYQNLTNSMTDIKAKKGESKITFITQELTPNDVMENSGKIGLVIWVDRNVMIQAHDKLNNGEIK